MGNWNKRTEPRIGIMLHYDDSTSDASGIRWLTKDPRCKVSYNDAVRDDGAVVSIAPRNTRAWHAGVCRSSDPDRLPYRDANSAFYGVAITANGNDTATEAQIGGVVILCRQLFEAEGWDTRETWRIVSHSSEAWPRGRKADCEGQRASGKVLDPEIIRQRLKEGL